MPNTSPTVIETKNAKMIELTVTMVDNQANLAISRDIKKPKTIPKLPPTNEIIVDSITN